MNVSATCNAAPSASTSLLGPIDYLMILFINTLKITSNLHENSGTAEYFAGQ